MNQREELARRYRQRLALYPRAYRREHEEEMLAVLLECARPGQEFPRIVESLDLIGGALRMRLRLLQPYEGNIGIDALAAFSLLAPLLLLGPVLATLMLHLVHGPAAPDPSLRARFPLMAQAYYARDLAAHGVNLATEGQLAVAIAVMLRLRRLAVAVIGVVLALWIFDARYGFSPGGVFSYFFLTCYGLEAAALIASPGPRRGLQLLSWKSGAVLAAAAAALTVTWTVTVGLAYGGNPSETAVQLNGVSVLALVILAAGVFLLSQLGRYVVALFAAMFCPYLLFLGRLIGDVPIMTQVQALVVLSVPPVVALGAIVAVAYRHRNRPAPDRPHGTTA